MKPIEDLVTLMSIIKRITHKVPGGPILRIYLSDKVCRDWKSPWSQKEFLSYSLRVILKLIEERRIYYTLTEQKPKTK